MRSAIQVKNRLGLTLIEVLVALVIFGSIMALAFGAIVNGLTTQAEQEANVSAQAKLRRILEVVSQDVRGAVFGSIIDTPYASGAESVSFLLLTGGAGYALTDYLLNTTQVEIISASTHSLVDQQVLIVNQHGRALLTRIRSVTNLSGTRRLELLCPIPVPHSANTLLFEASALGISYDEAERQLWIRSGQFAEEAPFAFDISEFRIDYVYTAPGTSPVIRSSPRRTDGLPDRTYLEGSTRYTLSRLQVIVGTEAEVGDQVRDHSYSAQIDLLGSQDFTVRELTTCL